MKHLLEIDSVQKAFDNKPIITDAYLKCETGDIIGLLGRNGSGKSTLLKIIFGILSADFKFVRIDGIVRNTTSDLLREVSYLSQDNFIPGNFTVRKAIALSIPVSEQTHFQRDPMIEKIWNNKISNLSGGELRYLEIKLVLCNPSNFVLLDEPYNGLTPVMIEKVNGLILAHAQRRGIIITDHNYENVLKISTRLILMKEGKAHHLKGRHELVDKGYLNSEMLRD